MSRDNKVTAVESTMAIMWFIQSQMKKKKDCWTNCALVTIITLVVTDTSRIILKYIRPKNEGKSWSWSRDCQTYSFVDSSKPWHSDLGQTHYPLRQNMDISLITGVGSSESSQNSPITSEKSMTYREVELMTGQSQYHVSMPISNPEGCSKTISLIL